MASASDNLPLALELTFDAASSRINLSLFEHAAGGHGEEPVPLKLAFDYAPDSGYAPSSSAVAASPLTDTVREVVDGRNDRIKEHYWKLWGCVGQRLAFALTRSQPR